MNASNENVKGLVSEIRKRWRRRALIQGGALTLLTLLFFATVLLLLYTTMTVEPVYLVVGVIVAAVIVLGVLAQFVLRPGLRKLSDRQIALFVEEKIPDLEDRLNSAVEVGEADARRLREEHGVLVDRIIDDALRKTKAITLTTVIDRKRERILTYSAAVFLVAFLLFGYTALDKIQFTASGFNLSAVTAGAVPFMTIDPGDVEIEKGASQEVFVTLRDEPDQDVVIVYKEGEGTWQKEPMQKGTGASAFLQEFFNIQESIQYYVEMGETRSEPYVISLYEFPDIGQIDVTYRYPDYTGLPSRTEEDNGDIRGLKGSTVTVTLKTTGTVQTAEMILDDDRTIPLNDLGDGRFRGSLKLEEENLYSLRLTDAKNKNNKFPDEYQIVPVEDEKPYITITDPQRDVRANAIEEVLVAADVQDDFGVKSLTLVYSINGDEEQAIRLKEESAERLQDISGEHLFFLEDYSLEPGDVISYYLEAEDYFHPSSEATDMYFIEVIPFDQKFSQVNNAGGGGGSAGQQSGLVLSQQEIIAATWKLLRQRDEMEDDEYDETAKALAQAQENLKANIEERINSTAFSMELQGNEVQQKVVEYLRKATEEMTKAVLDLRADELKKAMTPERRALNNLLRADALNKENQVTRGQGGGGGQSATEERMTELMDLELDISKDKYEVQNQRNQQQQQSQELDETLRKVQELARRQQNLANQNNPDQLEGEDKKRFIDQLKREQDELREQVEQLAQNMQQQMSRNQSQNGRQSSGSQSEQETRQQQQQMQQRLDRVARNMREAERELQRENLQDALRRQQQALNELERLQQELQRASRGTTREMLEDLAQQFDEFRDQEEQLGRDIDEAAEEAGARGGQADEETLDRLEEKRATMIDNLQQLMDQAEAVQEQVQQEDRELATTIRNLIQQARRDGLEENMRKSQRSIQEGWVDTADRIEEDIQAAIERLETQRRAFEDSLPVTEEESLAQSLEDVRDLMRQLEQLQAQAERMRQQQNGGQQGQQEGQQQGQQGQQQGQQEGQQEGQQQGQQGQQQGQQEGQQQGQQQGQNGQGGNRQGRADGARMQSQMERAQETLERLQRDFANDRAMQGTLNRIQNALTRADHTGVLLDEASADDYFDERVYDPLSQLEVEIARQLDLIEMDKKLYGSRKGDVPPEYREMVEKYYESLSKDGNR